MDKRFIFRYRSRTIKSPFGAGWGRLSAAIGHAASKLAGRKPEEWGMPWLRPRQIQLTLRLREKPNGGSRERPYRRPTLVAGCENTKVDG